MEIKSSSLFEIPLTEAEAKIIDEHIPVRTFKKGTLLLKEGQIAKDGYHIVKGCVRLYYLSNGEEWTTAFFTEDQSVASMTSYVNQVPADHYLECVEDCILTVLNYHKEKELIRKFPKFESLCRISMEQNYGESQSLLANYITKSPEARYMHLLETRPDLLNRVPQYHLASYLGVKPESLSRIRKRLTQKA